MAVIGSSLGGFYATWVATQTGCRAVLLNPAVHPARDLAAYVGEQTSFHNPEDHFFFQPGFVDELRALDAGPLKDPARFFARDERPLPGRPHSPARPRGPCAE